MRARYSSLIVSELNRSDFVQYDIYFRVLFERVMKLVLIQFGKKVALRDIIN